MGEGTCASDSCASIDTTGPLGKFVGPTWYVTETDTVTCSDGTSSQTQTYPYETVSFTSRGPSVIQATAKYGCVFRFDVNGDTATLGNGPVTCSSGNGDNSFTSYTATTHDGRHLVTTSHNSVRFFDGTTCEYEALVTGTR